MKLTRKGMPKISEEELRNREIYLTLSILYQFSPAEPNNPNSLKEGYLRELRQLPINYDLPKNRFI